MLDANHRTIATPSQLGSDKPVLMVLIDTEEEFDWALPHDRNSTGVSNIAAQHRAHRVFDKFGIKPIYVIDYPVASQKDGWGPLHELHQDGLCEIGAHLHPWVNPPFDEDVNYYNSYPGNLPADLEREKLTVLTDKIAENFGAKPTVYKAGRYGVGPNTTEILETLGYEIDTSVVPLTDMSPDQGPDFTACGADPYWFGARRNLLEIPITTGFVGRLAGAGWPLYKNLTSAMGKRLHLPGIFARLGLHERINLTPEGITFEEHRRLTSAMLGQGQRVFSFTYHSPSLMPGGTPYVNSERDLSEFLDRFERYFDFFFGELDGKAVTPLEIKAGLQGA
jgi:hypothetical protein